MGYREPPIQARHARRALRKALEAADALDRGDVATELSSDDLAAMAERLGADPGEVMRALSGAQAEGLELEKSAFFGAGFVATGERRVPLALSADAHEVLVTALRRALGVQGRIEVVGRTLTWSSDPSTGRVASISFLPDGDHTIIRAEERLGPIAGGLFGGLGGGLGVGGGVGVGVPLMIGNVALGLSMMLGFVVLAYVLSRAIYTAIAKSRVKKLGEALDSLARVADELASRGEGRAPLRATPRRVGPRAERAAARGEEQALATERPLATERELEAQREAARLRERALEVEREALLEAERELEARADGAGSSRARARPRG